MDEELEKALEELMSKKKELHKASEMERFTAGLLDKKLTSYENWLKTVRQKNTAENEVTKANDEFTYILDSICTREELE